MWNVSNVRVDPRALNHTDKPQCAAVLRCAIRAVEATAVSALKQANPVAQMRVSASFVEELRPIPEGRCALVGAIERVGFQKALIEGTDLRFELG